MAAPVIINPRKAFVRIPVQRQNYLPLLTFLRTYDLNEKLPVPVFLRLHFRYFGGIVLYIQPFPRFAGENIPGKKDNALISLHGNITARRRFNRRPAFRQIKLSGLDHEPTPVQRLQRLPVQGFRPAPGQRVRTGAPAVRTDRRLLRRTARQTGNQQKYRQDSQYSLHNVKISLLKYNSILFDLICPVRNQLLLITTTHKQSSANNCKSCKQASSE
ncbi:MAG: hypothetical protein LUH46_02815 [Alistipes sp.]|nr:hypothetical protein [Alistipes sp.]